MRPRRRARVTRGALVRRLSASAAIAVLVGTVLVVAAAPGAHAQTAPPSTPTTTLPVDLGPQSVIPLPNTGHKPETPGDPGGWEQLLLFGILTVASAGIFGRVLWAARQHTKANRLEA